MSYMIQATVEQNKLEVMPRPSHCCWNTLLPDGGMNTSHPFRRGGQEIRVRDVVLVHDNGPRINLKTIVKNLVKGNDGLVCSVLTRTRHGVTNRPIAKFFYLELAN